MSRTGVGVVKITDDSATTVITTGDSSHVVPIDDLDGTGSLDYTLEGVTVGELELTLEVESEGRIIAYDSVVATVAEFEIVSPVDADSDGNIDDPADAQGLGGNELTFSSAATGVLTLPVHVSVTPDTAGMQTYLTDRIRIRTSAIDDSHGSGTRVDLDWDHAWVGEATAGEAQYDTSDKLWKATATFTGLPDENDDFGVKAVILHVMDGNDDPLLHISSEPIEVFFDRDATNHPGGTAGDPNWFYYWGQVHVNPNVTFDGTLASSARAPGIGSGTTRPPRARLKF